ncbi:hypothetical protein LCGC14_0368410 [marine sediment metagenome]|uniref:Uncharacterized protein n=1 Tax=marine sediment metagenome TaxID=412755 RepID=A0A0F9TBV7_9ZZZZ
MSGMMKLRSYKTVVLTLAKYSKQYSGLDLFLKVSRKYKHAKNHTINLMLQDLGVLDAYTDANKIEYDWDRVEELLKMIENE